MVPAVRLTTTGRHAPGLVEGCVYRSEAPVEPALAAVKAAVEPALAAVEAAVKAALAAVKAPVKAALAAVKAPETPVLNLLGYIRENFLSTRANDGGGRSR